MNRRKFLAATAGTAAAAIVNPAVLGAEAAGARSRAAAPTTVTYWQFSTVTSDIAAWNRVIAAFEAKNPDVKVNQVVVPWSEQGQKLPTAVATASAPDISMMGNDVVAQYAAIGALAPLDSYFQAWSKDAGRDIIQDFYPGDRLYYNYKGHWYGVPICEETYLLQYRKSLFKGAGLDPNKPPQTYSEMLQYAQAITKPSKGIYGLGLTGGIDYTTVQQFMTFWLAWGGRFLNAKGLCGFDTPEFRGALQFYTDLYTKYKVMPPDTPTYDNLKSDPLFRAGKVAMTVGGSPLYTESTKAIQDDIGLAYMPKGPKGRFGFLGGWPLVMWSQSRNKDAAFRFMRFAGDPLGSMSQLCQALGVQPGRQLLASKPPYNTYPNKLFVGALLFAQPYQYPYREIPQMGSLEVDAVQLAVQSVMLGKSSVDQATKALVLHINTVLQP
jgi:multiple sugar transport system substrate-binding protein